MRSLKLLTVTIGNIDGDNVHILHGISEPRLNQYIMEKGSTCGVTGVLILLKYWYNWNVCDLYEVHFTGGDSRIVPCALFGNEVSEKQTYSKDHCIYLHTTQLFCRFCGTECVRELILRSSRYKIDHPEPGALLRYSELSDIGASQLLTWFEISRRDKRGIIDRGYDCRFVIVSDPEGGEVKRLRIGTFSETYIVSYDGKDIDVEMLDHSEVRRIWERSQEFPTPGYNIRTGEPKNR